MKLATAVTIACITGGVSGERVRVTVTGEAAFINSPVWTLL
jgi:hypothetical protein